MPERDIRKALKKRVEESYGELRAVKWIGRRNAPDVLLLLPTHYLSTVDDEEVWCDAPIHPFVETKAPKGEPTDAQAREHDRMRKAGCTVWVISTFEQLDYLLPPR